MNRLYILLLIFTLITSCKEKVASNNKIEKVKSTTFYLIRHAEKDRSNPAEKNPNLTEKGVDRARLWARYFDSIPLTYIYTTSYNRTKQTIAPVSNAKNIIPKTYSPNEINIQEFIKSNYGKNVLISGHSNTTPAMVNKLINEQKFSNMLDSDNKSLFVVKLIDSNMNVEVRSVYLEKE